MPGVKTSHFIEAEPSRVFELFSDLENGAQHMRGIEKIELLTEGPMRVGTKWRETRLMFNKSATEEMEITEFEPNQSYTAVAESHGTHYTTVFRFTPEGSGTKVEVDFQAKPVTFMAKLFTPLAWLMNGMVKKCIVQDIEDLKAVAEGKAADTPGGQEVSA